MVEGVSCCAASFDIIYPTDYTSVMRQYALSFMVQHMDRSSRGSVEPGQTGARPCQYAYVIKMHTEALLTE